MATVDVMPTPDSLEKKGEFDDLLAELERLRAKEKNHAEQAAAEVEKKQAQQAEFEKLYAREMRELADFREQAEKEARRKRVLEEEQEREVLLRPNPHRYVLLPIKYPEIWNAYEKHRAVFWEPQEVKQLGQDVKDWKEKLTEDERHFIKHVLGFFAASDGIVLENLGERFMTEVQIPEARCFYAWQMATENIHAETYGLLLDTLITDAEEKDKMFHAIENFKAIRDKAEWAIKYINSADEFAIRLAAFAVVEGVFFSGSFCSIFWLKKRALMPGLCLSNEFISRDEGLHTDYAVLLFHMLQLKPSQERIHEMFKEAVAIEKAFICEALPCSLIGMNADMMSRYIEYVADRLLVQLGYEKIWGTELVFDWMESISLEGQTSFFERPVSDYGRPGAMASAADLAFGTDADF